MTMTDAPVGTLIDRYLAFADAWHGGDAGARSADSTLRRIAKTVVPIDRRGTVRLAITDCVRPWQRRRARALMGVEPLLLHIGSGDRYKDGWVNIDLAAGDRVEIAWNLTRPLPFPEGTVDGVFSEHVLEHLSLRDGLQVLRNCRRALRAGGVLRIGVPDAGRILRAYVDGDDFIEATRPGRPTPMLAVQELFYWHRHLTMYDADTLTMVTAAAGFTDVREMPFGRTRLPSSPDTPHRELDTLYVEAVA